MRSGQRSAVTSDPHKNKWPVLKNWKVISDISYTYKGRLARDFGGIFEYFWEKIELIVANPIELCQTTPIVNKKQIKGKTGFI